MKSEWSEKWINTLVHSDPDVEQNIGVPLLVGGLNGQHVIVQQSMEEVMQRAVAYQRSKQLIPSPSNP